MMTIMKDNGSALSKSYYFIPNMNKWLITQQLPNINEIYKIGQNNGCNNG